MLTIVYPMKVLDYQSSSFDPLKIPTYDISSTPDVSTVVGTKFLHEYSAKTCYSRTSFIPLSFIRTLDYLELCPENFKISNS